VQYGVNVVRYVPDDYASPSINIGVIAHDLVKNEFKVVFLRDWGRVLGLDPCADTEMLGKLEESLQRQFDGSGIGGHALLAQFEESWSNILQLSAKEVVEAESVSEAAELAFKMQVFHPIKSSN